jgi:hypothetical protein
MIRRNHFLILIGVAFPATFCWGNLAATKATIDPRLVGTWHSVEIQCADESDHPSSRSVLSAELTIEKTGQFTWSHFVDLEEPNTCSGHLKLERPNSFQSDDCDLDPYDGRAVYEISERSLTLTGTESREPGLPPQGFTIRLVRGPLRLKWRAPDECLCDQAPLPQWTASAIPVTSTSDFVWLEPGTADAKRLIADSNHLLWRAVQAFDGKAGPIALKHTAYSMEGDKLEEYLLASRGRAVVVSHTNEGMIEHLSTCTCPLAMIKLKVKSHAPAAVWRFLSTAPRPSEEVYIAYPADPSRNGHFPPY